MKKILFILAAILLATSCVKKEQFHFGGVDNLGISNVSLAGASINGDITITNDSRKTLTIDQVELNLFNGSDKFAVATLQEPVVIKKQSSQTTSATMRLRTSSGVGAFALIGIVGKLDQIMVDGHVVVKIGALSKKVDIPLMPAKELANSLGGIQR